MNEYAYYAYCNVRPITRKMKERIFLIFAALWIVSAILNTPSAIAGEIHKAALNGDSNKVGELLAQDPELISSSDSDKRHPLLLAASGGHLDIVNLLIAKGADVNASTPWDGTALHVASCNGHSEVVKTLLSHGAKVDALGPIGAPLHCAAYNGHEFVAKVLLAAGATRSLPDQYGRSPFQVAINQDQFKFALFLLSEGESVDIRDGQNRTPLENAVVARNEKQTRFLLKHKANVNVDDGQVIHWAIISENKSLLRLVLENKPNLKVTDKAGNSPLHWAVRAPQYNDSGPTKEDIRHQEAVCDWVVALLADQAGINVNAKNTAGETPLKIAKSRGFMTVAGILLKHGAVE